MGDWVSDQIERLRTDAKERAAVEETLRITAKRDVLTGALWYALLDGDEPMARQDQAYQMYWRAYICSDLQ